MNNVEKINMIITHLNEKGIDKAIMLLEVLESMELYNKNTSSTRSIEIQLENKIEIDKINEESSIRQKKQDRKESECQELLSNYKKLFDLIDGVNLGYYSLRVNEVKAIAYRNNSNVIDASFDYFRIGFLKGQMSERAKAKKKVRNAA